MNAAADIRFTGPEAGDILGIAGGRYRILVDGHSTGGAFAIIEMHVPPGGGPPPHRHAGFQETFFVAAGEVEMRSENGRFTAGKGSTAHIPLNGPVHCFRNTGAVPATLICTVVPAGLEEMFRESGVALKAGEPTPVPEKPGPEQVKKLQELAERYGQQIFPPDYLDQTPPTVGA